MKVAIRLFRLAEALRRAPLGDWYLDGFGLLGRVGLLEGRIDSITTDGQNFVGVLPDPQQFRELDAWGRRAHKILPTLSRATVGQWKSPMRELFRLVYGEKFDQHPYLQKLKKSVIGHAKDIFGKQGPGVVRQAMLRKVLQALNSIAPLD